MSAKPNNLSEVSEALERFDELIRGLKASLEIETLAPRVHILRPRGSKGAAAGVRDVALTVSALIHGVEVAGLAVLVEFLDLVTRGKQSIDWPLGIALGNIPAAEKGVRFVERDLNRSFGRAETATHEDRRADELEGLFARSDRLLDIHQVKLSIDRPFWIFPYTKPGFEFARMVAPDVSLITHWGKGFSQEGQCSDEWVNNTGGVGVTVELGQNGFAPDQIALGLKTVVRAVEVTGARLCGKSVERRDVAMAPIYTWGEIIPYPQTGEPVLDKGWHNFKIAKAGERVGAFNGQDVVATVTGPVLFPKYPDPLPDGSYSKDRPAAELMRILKEISEADLPAGKVAVVAGATGLVGRELVRQLCASAQYKSVIALTRRQDEKLAAVSNGKLTMSPLPNGQDQLTCDEFYCALGTTINTAGSREAFRAVDHDLVIDLATRARNGGAKRVAVVSAVGSDANSKIFYSRVKGEMERDLLALGIPRLDVYQPSFLMGDRAENRPGERIGIVIAKVIAPLLGGSLAKYKPIRARDLARLMIAGGSLADFLRK